MNDDAQPTRPEQRALSAVKSSRKALKGAMFQDQRFPGNGLTHSRGAIAPRP